MWLMHEAGAVAPEEIHMDEDKGATSVVNAYSLPKMQFYIHKHLHYVALIS